MPVRLTESYLRKIIREEVSRLLNEQEMPENPAARRRIAYDVKLENWEILMADDPTTGKQVPSLLGNIMSEKVPGKRLNFVYRSLYRFNEKNEKIYQFNLLDILDIDGRKEIYLQHIGEVDTGAGETRNRVFLLINPKNESEIKELENVGLPKKKRI